MKNLNMYFPACPGYKQEINLCIVGRGKHAYLWVGSKNTGGNTVVGTLDNSGKLRSSLRNALKRLEAK